MITDAAKKNSSIINLNDGQLNKAADFIMKIIRDEIQEVYKRRKKIQDKIPLVQDFELQRLVKFQTEVLKARTLMMKRVDELSGLDI